MKRAKCLNGKKDFEKIYINRALIPLEQREQKLFDRGIEIETNEWKWGEMRSGK